MSAAHFHLLINHFPLIGTVFGIIVLLAGLIWKKNDFKIAAYGIFVLTALLAIPAFLSGEPAEEIVEQVLPKDTEAFVEEHEEMASFAIWFIGLLGVLAAVTMFFAITGNAINKSLGVITLLLALVVFGLIAKVNNSGGEIRHTEIRKSNGVAIVPEGANSSDKEEDD